MLKKVHLTNIFLEKHKCVREEVMMNYYRGLRPLKMSVGDQIENFMASVTNQDNPIWYFPESTQLERPHSEYEEFQSEYGFQLKMLTDEEDLLLKIPDCDSTAKFSLSISTQISITLQRGVDIKGALKKTGFQIEVLSFENVLAAKSLTLRAQMSK